MLHQDARFVASVERAVAEAEAKTLAEIVVVAAPKSGSYTDVAWRAGAVAGLLTLAVALFSPIEVSPEMVLVDVLLAAGLVGWICTGPRAVRALTTAARRERQVLEAAAAAFHEEAVHATTERIGVLVYVSALEGRVVLDPDLGVEAHVPEQAWGPVRAELSHDDLDHFLAGLQAAAEVLARHLPAPAGERAAGALANAPRIRA